MTATPMHNRRRSMAVEILFGESVAYPGDLDEAHSSIEFSRRAVLEALAKVVDPRGSNEVAAEMLTMAADSLLCAGREVAVHVAENDRKASA